MPPPPMTLGLSLGVPAAQATGGGGGPPPTGAILGEDSDPILTEAGTDLEVE